MTTEKANASAPTAEDDIPPGISDPGICWACGREFTSIEQDLDGRWRPYCRRCDLFTDG